MNSIHRSSRENNFPDLPNNKNNIVTNKKMSYKDREKRYVTTLSSNKMILVYVLKTYCGYYIYAYVHKT